MKKCEYNTERNVRFGPMPSSQLRSWALKCTLLNDLDKYAKFPLHTKSYQLFIKMEAPPRARLFGQKASEIKRKWLTSAFSFLSTCTYASDKHKW